MGQYYYPTIIRKNGTRNHSEQFYSHNYGNGLKLMEHSYVGNNFTETVIAQLYDEPGRLAWMGDYHEKGDIKNEDLDTLFREHYKKFNRENNPKKYSKPEETGRKGRFILNHDKKLFIDMDKYSEIMEDICKKYKLSKWESGNIRMWVALFGPAPTFKGKEND